MRKVYLIAITMFVLLFTANANAFSIVPSKTVLTMDPTNTKSISIEVSNTNKKDITFLSRVLGVRQKNDGTPEFVSGINPAENWIKLKDKSISLKSGQKGNIVFDIVVPKGVKSGSYYLAIAIKPQSQDTKMSAIVGEMISLLNIQVSGIAYESVVINKWEFDKTKSDTNNWIFNLNLANRGNMDVVMSGTVSIMSWRGNELMKQSTYLGNKFLSNSVRFLQPSINTGKNVIIPSAYQAKIQINYGLLNQSVVSTEYVIYFPFWGKVVLVVFILILLIVILGLVKARKRRKK